MILELVEGIYTEVGSFTGEDKVRSPQFAKLNLTAKEVFTSGENKTDG